MPIKVQKHHLPPTPLIPNSPLPLLHYPALLKDLVTSPTFTPTQIFDLFSSNAWQPQWIALYGPDIQSHYHSTTHEAMVVISGHSATIRFGVGDAPDWKAGTLSPGDRGKGEEGGLEITPGIGDVFIIPAGVAHKTFKPVPSNEDGLAFHQPLEMELGKGSECLDDESVARHREFFGNVRVDGGFMMMGAYPRGGVWDFMVGDVEERERVWGLEVPETDPVLGGSEEGLVGLWKDVKVGGR